MERSILYLGTVSYAVQQSNRGPLVKLSPAYQESDDRSKWQPIESVQEEFPNRGLVTWFRPPEMASPGTAWQFHIEQQETFRKEIPEHDRFKVVGNPSPVFEVLDFAEDDLDEMRRCLTVEGIHLPYVPSPRVCFHLADDLWIGPVSLTQKSDDCWVLVEDPSQLPCIAPLVAKSIQQVRIEHSPRALLGPTDRPRSIGRIDWAPDNVLLKHVLSWMLRIDKAYSEQLALSKQAIEHATSTLYPNIQEEVNRVLLEQRLNRAREIVAGLSTNQTLTDKLQQEILALPKVQELLKEHQVKTEQQLKASLQTELTLIREKALADVDIVRTQETELRDKIARLNSELVCLEQKASERRLALEKQFDELDTQLTTRIEQILARPHEVLADAVIFRALFQKDRATDGASGVTVHKVGSVNASEAGRGASKIPETAGQRLDSKKDLRSGLRQVFRNRRLPAKSIAPLDSAFLSGCIPILNGANAYSALEGYASVVASSRLLWIPVPAATLEPGDLIGKADPTVGRFIPNASGLADLLIEASKTPNKLYLVVLDGINRAPMDAYLSPIIGCYTDFLKGNSARALPILHPSMANSDDPYCCLVQFPWPANVLLSGIWTDGVTIQASRSFWSSALFINLDGYAYEAGDDGGAKSGKDGISDIDPALWKHWREEDSGTSISSLSQLLETLPQETVNLRATERELCERFYQSVRSWTGDESQALIQVVKCCLGPQLVESDETRTFCKEWAEGRFRDEMLTDYLERTFRLLR